MSDPQRLDSWKEIARYLRRAVPTATRCGRERGLPVPRVPAGPLSRDFAYPNELDEWLRGSAEATLGPVARAPEPAAVSSASPRKRRLVAGTAIAATLAGVAAVAALVRPPEPVARLE